MGMKLSVVIVSYNVKYILEQCLRSVLRASADFPCEILVVDNDSTDGTVDYLRKRFPQVRLIANKENVGFSRANNQAIGESTGQYVLLLNPDTLVAEDTLRSCLDFLDARPTVGAVGVRMLNSDGSFAPESRRGLPTPFTSFCKMTGLGTLFPKSRLFGRYYMRYLMYGEDIDLSYRLLQGGWENYYLPCTILHYKGESTVKSSFRYVNVFYKAMLIFFNKHYGPRHRMLGSFIRMAVYVRAFLDMVQWVVLRFRALIGCPARYKAPGYLVFDFDTTPVSKMLHDLSMQPHGRRFLLETHSRQTGMIIRPGGAMPMEGGDA